MPVVQPTQRIIDIAQSSDPRATIQNMVGDLSKQMEVFYDLVLVAIFFRPEKTKGGIIRPVENVKEDAYQGKVGLVLMMGPDCKGPPNIEVGDWVTFSVGDGMSITVNNVPCRMVPFDRIRIRVADPELVF